MSGLGAICVGCWRRLACGLDNKIVKEVLQNPHGGRSKPLCEIGCQLVAVSESASKTPELALCGSQSTGWETTVTMSQIDEMSDAGHTSAILKQGLAWIRIMHTSNISCRSASLTY